MKMKLKTLKEIDLGYFASSGYEGSAYVDEDELKEELQQVAREWVRRMQNQENLSLSQETDFNFDLLNSICFIKHFFNLEGEAK